MQVVSDTDLYQTAVSRTMGDLKGDSALCNWALGLAGESGEVVELVKKHCFHGKPIDIGELTKELGDVLWYVAALCNTLGLSLSSVMAVNIKKLEERYPNGFTIQDSLNRKDTLE